MQRDRSAIPQKDIGHGQPALISTHRDDLDVPLIEQIAGKVFGVLAKRLTQLGRINAMQAKPKQHAAGNQPFEGIAIYNSDDMGGIPGSRPGAAFRVRGTGEDKGAKNNQSQADGVEGRSEY